MGKLAIGKIMQGGGGWGLCVRKLGRKGKLELFLNFIMRIRGR